MSWLDRLNCIGEEAARTNSFAHNPYVQRLYFKLLNACESKQAETAKKLIVQMGF